MQGDTVTGLPSSLITLADCSEGTLAGTNEGEVACWMSESVNSRDHRQYLHQDDGCYITDNF